jgi:hypothetical protein
VVHFTRIPHVRSVYCNRDEKHLLSESVQRQLSRRLISAQIADVFARSSDHTFAGTTFGIYVYLKTRYLAVLKNLMEDSKYTPQGSDLKELLRSLPTVLSTGKAVPDFVEVPSKGAAVRDFLKKCDVQVAASLSDEELEALLQTVGVSAKQWRNAGRQGLLDRLHLHGN